MGERKITGGTAFFMILTAVIFDLANIGVDVISFGTGGFLIDLMAAMLFGMWFSHLGCSLWSSRNAGRTLFAIFMSALPFTDLAFPWTWQVSYTIRTELHAAPVVEVKRPRSPWRL